MIKKVHISESNKATFVCPRCIRTKTVDVTKYKKNINRTKVKSKCICGCSWASILERRNRFRLTVNIPCICSHIVTKGYSESFAMRVADLSSSGLKIKPNRNGTIKTSDYFFDDPIIVDFNLQNHDKTHVRKTTYARHISSSHIGVEFESSKLEDRTIASYLLGQRRYQMDT